MIDGYAQGLDGFTQKRLVDANTFDRDSNHHLLVDLGDSRKSGPSYPL